MKKRILTGDRTTGRLHLGHYVGSLKNRVKLQDEYDTLILLADIQALTTHFERPELIKESIYEVAIDNLSVGLDPEKITFVQQSMVAAIAELTVIYSMLVSVNALRHNPTVKSEAKQYGYNDLSYGFLGYPVSQAADITFCRAELVPGGDDQAPHLEQTRKIVRRFGDLYGREGSILLEPELLLSDTPRLQGLDGNGKMSKSIGNAIHLSDDREVIEEQVRKAVTDTRRIHISDPGAPEVCSVGNYQKVFAPKRYPEICEGCRGGRLGCKDCKAMLIDTLDALLTPIRERRAYYEQRRGEVKDLILSGTARANELGEETLEKVKDAMGIAI